MFGFGIPDFLLRPEERKRIKEYERREAERRASLAIPWDPNMKWQKELNLQAKTYEVPLLFDCKPTKHANPRYITDPEEIVISKSGEWLYCNKRLKAGLNLPIYQAKAKGSVMFDGPVTVPAIHNKDYTGRWNENPYMSLTPGEILSLRTGTRLAKGKVVIGGLGLGYQLVEVSKRKQVDKILVVEKSKDLVDFIYKKIKPRLGMTEVELIVGDAYEVLPKLTADVALIDIFDAYYDKSWDREKFERSCPNIKRIWCWGHVTID